MQFSSSDDAYKALKKQDTTTPTTPDKEEENKPEVEVPDTAVTYNYLIGTGILTACALTGVVILRKRHSK